MLNYTFSDNNPVEGINYYRLRQVDFNSKSEISAVVWVKFISTASESSILSYPNPTSAAFTLEIPVANPENITIEIRESTGKLVRVNSFSAAPGLNKINYNLSQEPDGTYFIVVKGLNFNITKRLVKTGINMSSGRR